MTGDANGAALPVQVIPERPARIVIEFLPGDAATLTIDLGTATEGQTYAAAFALECQAREVRLGAQMARLAQRPPVQGATMGEVLEFTREWANGIERAKGS